MVLVLLVMNRLELSRNTINLLILQYGNNVYGVTAAEANHYCCNHVSLIFSFLTLAAVIA